ncbi:MAG: hypothetical protein NC343_03615 [Muribaculum sp.]|nr:hypothetical protein [Muribaculaceae bacterium]MCM1080816.1 hypothetical protein [Muribaculum sp.]
MKNFTSLMVAALAVTFGANAQDLVPEDIEIANPSFEEADPNVEGDVAHLYGWEKGTGNSDWWTPRAHTNSANDGDWYVRIASNDGLEPGTLIKQYVETGKNAGVYVLTAACNVSRNGWRGDINSVGGGEPYVDADNPGTPGTIFGALWIADDDDDPEDPDGRGFLKIGECKGDWRMCTIVYKSEVDEPWLEIGFGLPKASQGIPKPNIQCDNFKLQYYNTMDEEAVKALVFGTSGIDEIHVADKVVDNRYFNLQGMEVADPSQPGLYIHNGKKILVK